MRKITQKTVENFKNGIACKISNSQIKIEDWTIKYLLFDNQIASFDKNKSLLLIENWFCEDWRTKTTKERLNWILEEFGLWYIYQKTKNWIKKRFFVDKNWITRDFDIGLLMFKI